MHKEITSTQNATIKKLVQLQEKSRERRKSGKFAIEGFREIQLAQKANYSFFELYYCPQILSQEDQNTIFSVLTKDTEIIEVNKAVYEKIAYRGSTEGIIAIAEGKEHTLDNLKLPDNPLILISEAPEKPGNIGALLRTADAAGVDAFIIANPRTDFYNPNIIRSSVGGIFTQQIAEASTKDIIEFLINKKISIYSAILQDAKPYQAIDFTGPTALVVGTEADGLSPLWREKSYQNIIIPMQGMIDSMNVSVAAGILTFEARRQRGFKL